MDIQQLLKHLCERGPDSVVPFVGSGFVLDLGFPTWRKLLEKAQEFLTRRSEPLAQVMGPRITSGNYLAAAQLLYECEVPPEQRVEFLKGIFETRPELKRRQKLLAALPLPVYLTTNYDLTIERALTAQSRHFQSFAGTDRFTRFNSNLARHVREFPKSAERPALVLKVHNDVSDCENIVLSRASFDALPAIPGFSEFYRTTLRDKSILFLGFSGDDPNLREVVQRLIGDYAGYGLGESYLVLPEGDSSDFDTMTASPIRTYRYDPKDHHNAVAEFLSELNKCWSSRTAPPSPVAAPDPSTTVQSLTLLVNAVRRNADARIIESVALAMVQHAVRAAHPHRDERSVADRLAHQFRVGALRASELVRSYLPQALSDEGTSKKMQAKGDDHTTLLAKGLRQRCLAVDRHFQLRVEDLHGVVRDCIGEALRSQGGTFARALCTNVAIEEEAFSATVRRLVAERTWQRIGPEEKFAIGRAIADLFLKPNEEEAEILSRLAVTATAFGLIQTLPELSAASQLVPAALYLDTTCVLPLAADAEPRSSAYRIMLDHARSSGIQVVFLSSFMSEVDRHYNGARARLRDMGNPSVSELRAVVEGTLEEYANVFLVTVAARGKPKMDCLRALAELFGPRPRFDSRIESLGISIREPRRADAELLQSVQRQILDGKSNWYNRSPEARSILARNEAIQLVELEDRKGQAWFATADGQLRRVARERDLPGAGLALPIPGVIALLETVGRCGSLSGAYARVLWTPQLDDAIDAAIGELLRGLIVHARDAAEFSFDEAARLTRELYFERAHRRARPDDWELQDEWDAEVPPRPLATWLRDSALAAVGKLRDDAQRNAVHRERSSRGRRRPAGSK